MRLTLRTLLAYLDDILEPADAQELGQKIEESEFASGLVHRIRSVTRKLRLGAPKLTGKGMGLDANTVAEYLDNTLPQDRVPDFEKVCLESDVQLAEVASCHQILTLVLGEPADVDPAMQDRLRALSLSGEVASSYAQNPEEEIGEPAAPPISVSRPAAPTARADTSLAPAKPLPNETGIRLLPIAATLAVAFLLALVALVAMGPLDKNHPIVGGLFEDKAVASQDDATPPSDALRKNTPKSDPSSDVDTGPDQQSGPPTGLPPADGTPTTEQATDPRADSTDLVPPRTGLPALPNTLDSTTPPDRNDDPAGPDEDRATPPIDPTPGSELPSEPGRPDVMPTPDSDVGGDTVPDEPKETDVPPAEEVTEDLGRYTSDQQVAARLDPETGSWLRLPGLTTLAAGDRILALPTYRPQFLIAPGLQVVLVGPAEVMLQGPNEAGVAGLDIKYGRAIVVTDGKSGTNLNLQIGKRLSQVTFVNTDSMMAVDVQRYLPPGSDPEVDEAYLMTKVYAVNAQLKWQDQGSPDSALVDPGQLAALVDVEPMVTGAAPSRPDWLDSRSMTLIDRDASKQLEPRLSLGRALTVSLQEQVANRLVEVRTLAIRSLGQLGDFDSFLDALNDSELRSYWHVLFDGLRDGMRLNPDSATDVRVAVERLRGDDGQILYRLLRGYSPAQLNEGGARELVEALESPSMDIRVMAYENLRRITQKTHLFRPDREPRQQKSAVLNWRKSLQNGTIQYKDPPPALPVRPADAES